MDAFSLRVSRTRTQRLARFLALLCSVVHGHRDSTSKRFNRLLPSEAKSLSLLIISHFEDMHATVVAAAASLCGHDVLLWSPPEASNTNSFSIRVGEGPRWTLDGSTYHADSFEVVWNRRKFAVKVPSGIHEDDLTFAQSETTEFFTNLWAVGAPSARLINSLFGTVSSHWKLRQLVLAEEVGLRVPRTISGNEREDIASFIGQNSARGSQTIYKTFRPMAWINGNVSRAAYTSVVTREQIDQNAFIEAVPGIYQERIEKEYEVRATFFGEREYSARIDSASMEIGKDDWRAEVNVSNYLSPTTLPDDVREKCLDLMSRLSIEMGCFDFVVDTEENYFFLEVNPQGQFLWVESECEEIKMLRGFIDFIFPTTNHDNSKIVYSGIAKSDRHKNIAAEFSKRRMLWVPREGKQ